MTLVKDIEKAMIDKDVKSALELHQLTGVSYYKCLRLLKGDGTVRLKDAATIADHLGCRLSLAFN